MGAGAMREQREHIRKLERELRQRDRALSGFAEQVADLQTRLRQQRIEMLFQDMGAPKAWTDLYLQDERPAEPDELDLADWIREYGLEFNVSKPLPVRLTPLPEPAVVPGPDDVTHSLLDEEDEDEDDDFDEDFHAVFGDLIRGANGDEG